MPKKLTTAQAWRVIATDFERFASTGRRPEKGLTNGGLCWAASLLHRRHRISIQQWYNMTADITAAMGERDAEYPDWLAYLAPCDQEGAGLRAMLATIYAEESDHA